MTRVPGRAESLRQARVFEIYASPAETVARATFQRMRDSIPKVLSKVGRECRRKLRYGLFRTWHHFVFVFFSLISYFFTLVYFFN